MEPVKWAWGKGIDLDEPYVASVKFTNVVYYPCYIPYMAGGILVYEMCLHALQLKLQCMHHFYTD